MQEIFIKQEDIKKIVAVVENGKLVEKYEEKEEQERLEGNIYLGKVENVLIGMQSAFVDIGINKNTFIHLKDIIPKISNETGNKNENLSKYNIKDYISTGKPILVQVKKDATSKKGAKVSCHISMPGRFIVLMPETEFITISKKIENQQEKNRLKNIVKENLPKGYGIIIRTSAEGKEEELIKQDIQRVLKQHELVLKKFEELKNNKDFTPSLLYENDGIIGKTLTDLVDQNLVKITTNTTKIYNYVKNFLEETGMQKNIKLELKNDDILKIYDIEEQIEKASSHKIWLKCGGFITIDKTEALTAIDVNSGKYVGIKDLEQTVYTVNREASFEIAKQIRLRDIGGIIIIDYIDMERQETKQKILQTLEEALKKDRSKTQIVGFTPLDLLEMTRKQI